jgi:hypothetical protein
MSTRMSRLLWGLLPIAFLFWLYSDGLKTWFMGDDFAWLGLLRQVHASRSLLNALFAPEAQGTIRPWSERGFFLLFESLFGLDGLPFRICVFTTMAANVTLVAWITRRITGSPFAAVLAPILWTANSALITVMAWSSAYNEALCPLFLLAAMACFIRYVESGRRVFWWWQLVVFTLGFGALEINVVYPALAAAYVLFVVEAGKRRKLLLGLAPLLGISIAYFLVHLAFAPLPKEGAYALHVDSRIFRTLAVYWRWTLLYEGRSFKAGAIPFWMLTVALTAFVVRQLTKSRHSVLFFMAWFLITLAPMVPLADHHSDYYLTIPLIGLGMLGGFAISQALESTWVWRATALILLVTYLGGMVPNDRRATRWWLDKSRAVRGLVLGVQAAHDSHPGKIIVLDGVKSDLYDSSIGASAITSVGLNEAYLTPASKDTIHPTEDFGKLAHVVLDPGTLRRAITHEQVVVYSDVGDHLRNVTGVWERLSLDRKPDRKPDQLPRRVEVGNPLLAYLLGPEWYGWEAPGFRWMPQRATVRLAGPGSDREKLVLEGRCPESQLKSGPVRLSVSVDGISLTDTQIGEAETEFQRLFVVPPSLVGRDSVEVAISVDRVFHEEGGRALGLVFGTVAFEQ